jgi:hypothetical protein
MKKKKKSSAVFNRVASILGTTAKDAREYCHRVRFRLAKVGVMSISNQDIADTLAELGSSATVQDVVGATISKLPQAKRSAIRIGAASEPWWAVLSKAQKTASGHSLCRSCGRVAIPGSDTCYTCSSK